MGAVCPEGWERLPPIEYVVDAGQQLVVKQEDGAAPQKLQNCSVVNKTNWKCSVTGNLREGFTEGEYLMTHGDEEVEVVYDGIKSVPN